MKKWQLLVALAGSMMVMAAPCAAQKRPPPTKPSISSQQGKPSSRSGRTGAASAQVSSGKAVAQRGKPSLRAQKANLVRLIGRAEGLKPARFQLRQQTVDARRAYKANPSSANRAAWRAAVRAYLPVRQAHETARGQRAAAMFRYKQSKFQRQAAMKSAAQAVPAATPPRLPPQPGRPAIRRQAAVRLLPTLPVAMETPVVRRPTYTFPNNQRPGAHYASSAAAFKEGMKTSPIYSSFAPTTSFFPPAPGTGSVAGTAGSFGASGTAGSSGTSGTIPLNRLDAQGLANYRQNAAAGGN